MTLPRAALEPTIGFNLHSFAILLHVILFVYWLGSDLGVFYASRFVVNPKVPFAGRQIALRIMSYVDLAPRVTLILILPSGVTLMAASDLGRDIFLGWPLIAIWVGAIVWLFIMINAFHKSARSGTFGRMDLIIRWAAVLGLVAVGLYAVFAATPFGVTSNPKWLGFKVTIYGLCIFSGLMIRRAIVPIGPAMHDLSKDADATRPNEIVAASMKRAIPWVLAIWVLVACAAFLGVFKPGATL